MVRIDPDVLFTDIYQYDAWFAKAIDCPILAHLRGDFWTEFEALSRSRRSPASKFASAWLKYLMDRGVGFAHTVLPICNWLAEQVTHRRPDKRVKVLYQAIESEIWNDDCETLELRHPAIISVFDFRILPKLEGLIRFFDVARAMPDFNFYVAGTGPYIRRVLAEKPRNMTLQGHLCYPDEVKAFLRAGDVYVHPSGLDACPLTVMEAQLMEKPVVATNVGGVPEIVCDKRLLTEDGDTDGWVSKINWLLDNPAEAAEIGRSGRQFIEENFSLNRISRDLFACMEDVA